MERGVYATRNPFCFYPRFYPPDFPQGGIGNTASRITELVSQGGEGVPDSGIACYRLGPQQGLGLPGGRPPPVVGAIRGKRPPPPGPPGPTPPPPGPRGAAARRPARPPRA